MNESEMETHERSDLHFALISSGIVQAPEFDPSSGLSRIVRDNSGQPQTGEQGSFTQNPWSSMFITPGYYVRESRFA